MDIFRSILTHVFSLFARLFKIQQHWVWEIFSVLMSIAAIGLLIWGLIALFSHKKETITNKYKRILYNVSFYSLVGLQISFLLFFIGRIGITIYIASSDSKLSDYTFDAQALQYELTNIFIYDQQGNRVYKVVHNSTNRDVVSLDEVPAQLQRAFVDVEDKRFYQHIGVSILRLRSCFFL